MKLQRSLAVLVALVGLASTRPAFADGSNSVVLVNSTSYTVYLLYASSSDASTWDTSNNLLSGQGIGPGQQLVVNVPVDGDGSCLYDLMAVLYGTPQYAYQYQVNACAGGTWTITASQ